MGLRLREADPARDGAACAAIYAPHVLEGIESFEEEAPDAEEMARRMLAAWEWLVADVAGEVAGFAYATRHRDRAAYRWAVDVSVYVAERRRGRGLASALYRELLERLSRRGFRVACAGITLPNTASVALHEGLGFEPVGVYRAIGFKAGAWRDVGWWQLALGEHPRGELPPAEPVVA